MQGPAMPTYRWGAGVDAPRPANMTNAEKCERWRAAHPDKVTVARKRDVFKRRRSPILDPITAAMLGYTRRGTGWVKHQNRNL
jgi:hypothetical protein